MNLIQALTAAKVDGRCIYRQAWVDSGGLTPDGERDYTIPSYIFYDRMEGAFEAVFSPMGAEVTSPRVEEDYMNGVCVSMFSVEDILAEDWITY